MSTRVAITEYLEIELNSERWHCRSCGHDIASARENYKTGLLVYDRDPREIHAPILDETKYEFTYAPDPTWCRIVEFYCPSCGTQIENEYLPPGHPLTHDIELDIDKLKQRHLAKEGQ
ncbi:acetone carboxylase subunit gamma [Thiomonas sp. FB-Cd]|jgi:acetone carboxylase gamma subunit|uniref:acetone carboxylase subunit gamma n=1 Tax=Thiomonas sp. FB-Cd TaxID=1158292 RepID=UPI0004DF56BF|nr:acetone carboxylase subunit gamma [Thiomonas sp. FB-Cd]